MPIFQYKCSECDEVSEYLLKSPRTLPKQCANEDCGADRDDLVIFDRIYHGETPARPKSSGSGSSPSHWDLHDDDCPLKQPCGDCGEPLGDHTLELEGPDPRDN